MYTLNADFSTSETTPAGQAAGTERKQNSTSARELEFQAALENYLSEYRLSIDPNRSHAGSALSSIIRNFVEWHRL